MYIRSLSTYILSNSVHYILVLVIHKPRLSTLYVGGYLPFTNLLFTSFIHIPILNHADPIPSFKLH